MKALLALTVANIRSYTRDRAAVFWTLAFPLVFIVLFGLIFQGSPAAACPSAGSTPTSRRRPASSRPVRRSLDGITLDETTE